MSDHEKVLFVQKMGNGQFETESLWCIKYEDEYIVDNIPFVAKRISLGDRIRVEYDEEDKAYYFDDFISTSGNSTVRLHFPNEEEIEKARNFLKILGCESEVFLSRKILAVNVPKTVSYKPVKEYLDSGEEKGQWEYEESCLCHDY